VTASDILPWVALRWGRARDPAATAKGAGDLKMLRDAGEKYGRLLVWDLEAVAGGDPQLEIYRRLEGKGLWVEGAAHTLGTLVDVLVAGAEVAVINGRRMRGFEVLTEANQLTGQLAYCVEEGPDLKTSPADPAREPADLFRDARRAGIERGVYLRYPLLHELPPWVEEVEDMELYAGPVPVRGGQPQVDGRVVANLYELV
jgi:hypothetical protein